MGGSVLFAEAKKSRDQTMAALQTLIDKFLLQNEVRPEFCDITEEDVVTWVRENTAVDVCASMDLTQNRTDPDEFRRNSWM